MSEEEQEAIEYLKAFQKDLYGASEKNLMAIYIDRVWNYIDKLQKENEYLKEREKYLEERRSDIINKFQNETTDTTIPKDKIKEIKDMLGKYEHHSISTTENEDIVSKCYEKLNELLEEE